VALLRYAGPGPHDDGRGGTVRPGDVWEWPGEPNWGPWEPVPDGEAPESAISDGEPPGRGAHQSHGPGSDGQGAASTGDSAATREEG
jgi:hypothetical protein